MKKIMKFIVLSLIIAGMTPFMSFSERSEVDMSSFAQSFSNGGLDFLATHVYSMGNTIYVDGFVSNTSKYKISSLDDMLVKVTDLNGFLLGVTSLSIEELEKFTGMEPGESKPISVSMPYNDDKRIIENECKVYTEFKRSFDKSNDYYNDTMAVYIKGEKVNFKGITPFISKGRTMVPVRGVFENIGADVSYDDKTETVTCKIMNNTVELVIGSNIAKVDDKLYELDVPAQIIDGRTVVPLRFIAERFDTYVVWCEELNAVLLFNENLYNK